MKRPSGPTVRIQKYIADCGVTSRRKAEALIQEGMVKLNGSVVTTLGTKIDPDEDVVEVRGELVAPSLVEKMYLVMNKPRGVMTTVNDPQGRPTVMDYCREVSERVYPVGRLDYLSEGLLLLTNDGDLAQKILHPKHRVVKTYEVKIFGGINERILTALRQERFFPEGRVKPISVRVIKQLAQKTWLEFKLAEGRNREIRRICEEVGLTIDKLKRVAIEGLTIHGVAPGKYRFIDRRLLLRLLNMGEDGALRPGEKVRFYSLKKSVGRNKLAKERPQVMATEEKFTRYRKDQYYQTLRRQKAQESASQESGASGSSAGGLSNYPN